MRLVLLVLCAVLMLLSSVSYQLRSASDFVNSRLVNRIIRFSLHAVASPRSEDHGQGSSFHGFSTNIAKKIDSSLGLPSIDEFSKQQKLQELIKAYQQKSNNGAQFAVSTSSAGGAENTGGSSVSGKKVFDDTIKFPTEFMLKIVGVNEPSFVPDMLSAIGKCLDSQRMNSIAYTTKETAGGKYVSLTVKPLFRTSAELYAVYDVIAQDKRVKFTL